MENYISLFLVVFLLCTPLYADDGLNASGAKGGEARSGVAVIKHTPRSTPERPKASVQKPEQEVSDIAGETSAVSESSGFPPGLNKKGVLSRGLSKKEKTPPGWEKGEKEGWEKESTSLGKKDEEKEKKTKDKPFKGLAGKSLKREKKEDQAAKKS